uniref:Ribosomal protein L32 n=1 Tax=Naravelia pilulifera TaxID=2011089 RepID=A0A384UHE9_9MAGN|nr:ribosomal protein L32 [Naravelia pilulifera]ASA34020.1 ribosomal protein L32 [Naravelia pilulifera]ASA46921.1 ribosomal protein L32 [Naravelia pilulifera]QFV18102.1 ribosomal protein L32 [Naravelia pilulifera]
MAVQKKRISMSKKKSIFVKIFGKIKCIGQE